VLIRASSPTHQPSLFHAPPRPAGVSLGAYLAEAVTIVLDAWVAKKRWLWSCTTFDSPGKCARFDNPTGEGCTSRQVLSIAGCGAFFIRMDMVGSHPWC